MAPFELAAEQRARGRRELADGREVVDQMAGVRLVARPGGDDAEQAARRCGSGRRRPPDPELRPSPGRTRPSSGRDRHASAHGPCAARSYRYAARAAGNGRPGATGRPSGPVTASGDGPLRVEEVEDRRDVDAGQPAELVADGGGRLLGARAGLEAGEGRGHLGTFAELAREAGLRRPERRDVALDRDVPGDRRRPGRGSARSSPPPRRASRPCAG